MSDSPSSPNNDWAAEAADRVVLEVDKVRDRTVPTAQLIARAVVYIPLIVAFGIILSILLVIAFVRLLDLFLPIWGVYVLLGFLFVTGGLILWKIRGRLEPAS